MGATIETEISSKVTHVVAILRGSNKTDKQRWANQNGVPVVGVSWLDACTQLWRRPPEVDFPPLGPQSRPKENIDLIHSVAGGSS